MWAHNIFVMPLRYVMSARFSSTMRNTRPMQTMHVSNLDFNLCFNFPFNYVTDFFPCFAQDLYEMQYSAGRMLN